MSWLKKNSKNDIYFCTNLMRNVCIPRCGLLFHWYIDFHVFSPFVIYKVRILIKGRCCKYIFYSCTWFFQLFFFHSILFFLVLRMYLEAYIRAFFVPISVLESHTYSSPGIGIEGNIAWKSKLIILVYGTNDERVSYVFVVWGFFVQGWIQVKNFSC